MQNDSNTIRLLIVEASQNEAEQMVSLFRNAGQATRAHRVTSIDDLEETIQTQTWDLLLASHPMDEINADTANETINRLNKDIPIIVMKEEYQKEIFTGALKAGFKDVVLYDEEERLVLVANRELQNLENRRQRRLAEVSLRETEKRCQLLLNSSMDAIAYVHEGMHIYANQSYVDLFGYPDADDLACVPIIDMVASEDLAEFKRFLKSYQSTENASDELACHGIKENGEKFKAKISFSPATFDGEPCTQIVIRVDQGNAELEEKLKEISTQDLLTGLYNQQYFSEQLDKSIDRAVGGKGNAAVFYITLDSFDKIRTEMGISDADLVLADFGTLLKEHIPAPSVLARSGDDLFLALIPTDNQTELSTLATKINKSVEDHLSEVGGKTAQTTCSIGITVINETTAKAKDILARTQRAREKVLDKGGNNYHFHTAKDDLEEQAIEGNVIAMIQKALQDNSFKLLFQPVISLRGDSEEHYEVLLRLINPNGEEVPPKEFLDAAEKSQMATKIDRWVILQSVKLLASHRAKGHKTRLFIHLSASSIQDKTLLPWVSVALKAARLPGDSIIFQLTEEDATTYMKQAKELTKAIDELRCKVSLTHFGCAINPFTTLKHLTVHYVKVDGSFSGDIGNPETQENLKTMISSLQGQGKLTIVPMVENATMLATLWQAGVNYIQGYYLQGPTAEMDYDFTSDEDE
ncbi:GGDEF domain-containing response regulator [Endozoicomonas sp. SM1973]|uniref:GGDEF domain-containing response regulator n=1 Tax=Spartinivicinus marinus TaxID=2994442 RepID=A0A853I8Y7_9GAMM|nr:GGDEF domain-containing response regulator [Spartinivicinus marinus]MCX4027563.1 GGDEF domain-containing response regulator [Spartinivicinus marinus]NYZ68192.1 GGDEF domain-containing response regulator [Spartinivicinus marinus]